MPLLARKNFLLKRFESVPIVRSRLATLNYQPIAIQSELEVHIIHSANAIVVKAVIARIDGANTSDLIIPIPAADQTSNRPIPPPSIPDTIPVAGAGFMSAHLPSGELVAVADTRGHIISQ